MKLILETDSDAMSQALVFDRNRAYILQHRIWTGFTREDGVTFWFKRNKSSVRCYVQNPVEGTKGEEV